MGRGGHQRRCALVVELARGPATETVPILTKHTHQITTEPSP